MKKLSVRIITIMIAIFTLVAALPMNVLANGSVAEEASGDQLSSPGYIEVNDGYIKIQVSEDNGGFYIGLVEGDKLTKADDNKNLLFPESEYDTSFTTFRVKQDGVTRDYIFGGDYSHLGLETSDVRVYKSADNAITAEWSVGGLVFTQIIAFMDTNSAMHGMAYITYSVENKSSSAIEDIQARVMMDTALGYQDYAIYMTANENGSYSAVTNEKTISGEDYNNFFYLYDSRTAPSVIAYTVNATVGGEIIVPDKVTFAHWNNLASTEFDYTPSSEDPIDFTSIYNADYMTADSAVALYYDMGAPAVNETGRAIGLYYGVYSNHTVEDSDVGLNFINSDVIKLNEDKTDYLDANGDGNGNFSMDIRLQNVSDKKIESLALAVLPGEFMYPYGEEGPVDSATPQNPYYIKIEGLQAGEVRDVRLDFEVDISNVTDYRRVKLMLYNTAVSTEFTEDNLILSKETYVFCPGSTSAELGFTGMVPQMTGETGRRFVYMTGSNFNLLRDKSQYRIILRPMNGGEDIIIDSSRLVVNPELNTATIVIDETLSIGTWQAIIDWNDAQIPDIVSDALRLDVLSAKDLDKAGITAAVSTGISVVRSGNGSKEDPYHYEIVEGYVHDALLQMSGNFNTLKSPAKGIYKAEAITLSEGEVINISGCLGIKSGRVTVSVEYDDNDKQKAINVDIDGYVFTLGANTKVWDGVCALTSFEEGTLYELKRYSKDGIPSKVSGETITLLWPGAASGAQTLVGLLLQMRYCEFGVMDTAQGDRRIVAFSAQLSPSFLIPNGNEYEAMRSPREEEEVRIIYANYTATDLRRVDNRYEQSDKKWRQDQAGTLNMYVDDILFGGYFIGFNASVEVGIPAIVDGMPYIEGTLALKIINDEWEFAVNGVVDLNVFEMEASLELKSYNGFPVVDKFYFFVGGFLPGVPVDPFGVFWIRGAGGGIDNIYDTFFGRDRVPPLTLMLSGEFAIFSVLSTKADLTISLRGFEAAFSDIKVAGIRIVDYLGGSVYWYPDLAIAFRLDVNIFDAIKGGGGITVRKDFFEAYIYAKIAIPDNIWLIGGLEVGSAELGVSTEKIWGKVKVIGIGVGVTYYWGGDVDIDVLNAARRNGRNIVAIGTDDEGNTLYMETTNNVRQLYTSKKSNSGVTLLSASSGGITSSSDKRNHSFILNTTAAEDGLVTVTYKAANELEAYDLKDTIKMTVGGESYQLKWLADDVNADDPINENANAMLKYDETTGEAIVSISLTDPETQIGKEISVTSGVASTVTVYGVERYADLTSAELGEDSVTVYGTDIKDFSTINVYVRDEQDNIFQVGAGIPANATSDAESGEESLVIPVVYPDSLPSGAYTYEVVGCLKDANGNEVANPVVEIEGEINYTNDLQPKAPVSAEVMLGGNYAISLDVVSDAEDFDGYMVDIYEVTEDGNVATSFVNVKMELDEGEVVKAGEKKTLTVGGRVLNTDADGNEFYTGLEAGKTYKISVSTYKTTESGTIVESKAISTEEITMVAPVKTEPVTSIEGSKQIAVGVSGLSVDTTNKSNVTVKIDNVGELRTGYYILNNGARQDWKGGNIDLGELEDGMYTLSIGGVNETGDSFSTVYQFSVDTKAPSLLITSPQGGGFYDTDSVVVTGMAESGATVSATAGGEAVKTVASGDGSFSITVPLDITAAYQDVRITVSDEAGNASDKYGFTLTNMLLGDESLELVVLLEGEEVSYISAGSEPLQLTLAFKSGNTYMSINENSVAAARISWRTTFVSGTGSVDENGLFTGETGSVGLLVATLDNYSASVEVIPTSVQTLDAKLEIPEGGYVYDGNAKEPKVTIEGETELVFGVDYTVSYLNNVNAGTATAIITALDTDKCSGSKVLTFEIAAAPITDAEIILSGDGKAPKITVKFGEKELVENTDYTLLIESNEDTDEGLVTVTGIGNFQGTNSVSYKLSDKFGGESDENTGNEQKEGNWFSRNAAWVIPVGIVVPSGLGVGIYFLFFKKKLFFKLFSRNKLS